MFTPSRAQTKISRFGDEEMFNDSGTIMIFTECYMKRGGTYEVWDSKVDKNADFSHLFYYVTSA